MFTKDMKRVAEQVLQLHPTNAVIYPGKRRQNVAFVTINAHCKRCKEANQPHKYTCVIKENCLDGNRPCATVHVTQDQHQHVTSSQSGDDNSVASTASSSTDNRSNSSSSSRHRSTHHVRERLLFSRLRRRRCASRRQPLERLLHRHGRARVLLA